MKKFNIPEPKEGETYMGAIIQPDALNTEVQRRMFDAGYESGWQACEAHYKERIAELEKDAEWVNASDRLPEEFVKVLAYRDENIGIGYVYKHRSGKLFFSFNGTSGGMVKPFTKWKCIKLPAIDQAIAESKE